MLFAESEGEAGGLVEELDDRTFFFLLYLNDDYKCSPSATLNYL